MSGTPTVNLANCPASRQPRLQFDSIGESSTTLFVLDMAESQLIIICQRHALVVSSSRSSMHSPVGEATTSPGMRHDDVHDLSLPYSPRRAPTLVCYRSLTSFGD